MSKMTGVQNYFNTIDSYQKIMIRNQNNEDYMNQCY